MYWGPSVLCAFKYMCHHLLTPFICTQWSCSCGTPAQGACSYLCFKRQSQQTVETVWEPSGLPCCPNPCSAPLFILNVLHHLAFYTSKYGYRMCLRVYLNGDGTGRGTHLSLFFVVMKGPNDALLRWPFNQKVGAGSECRASPGA